MSELHRVSEGLFEARRHPSERSEFHRGENKQSPQAEEQKSESIRINQLKIELLNMPVLALEIPISKRAEKPDPINSDTTISFLELIEIILKMIVNGAKAIFQKRKEKN